MAKSKATYEIQLCLVRKKKGENPSVMRRVVVDYTKDAQIASVFFKLDLQYIEDGSNADE